MTSRQRLRIQFFSFVILAALVFFYSNLSRAASCCGGGLSLPGLIVGDDQRLFSVTTSASQLREESLANGDWLSYSKPRTSQSLQMSVAQLLSDRWQLGVSSQLMRNDQNISGVDQSNVNFGDTSIFVGYEALPEWDYSAWRPRGYTFLQLVAPTGQSTESAIRRGTGVTGRGYWSAGPGVVLTKILGRWDAVASSEVHASVPRTENGARLAPDPGASAMLGAGYNLGNYRLSSSLTLNYEGPIRGDGEPSPFQRYTTAMFAATYSVKDDVSVSLSYADQTLFGEPVNSALNRTVALAVSKRWAR